MEISLPVRGLLTGANATKVPPGSLLEAENVMITRPGLAQPRPGFSRHSSCALNVAGYRPRALLPVGSDILVYSKHTTSGERWDWADSEAQVTGLPSPKDFTKADPRGAAARRNFYVTGSTGTFKLTSSGDTAAERAGMWRPAWKTAFPADSSSSAVAIATGEVYAHRALIRKRDASEVIVRSPPTLSYPRSNTSGGTRDPFVSVYLPSYAAAGDVVEVYRTVTVTGTDLSAVGGEFFLCATYVLVAADITAGYVDIRDRTPNASLGAPLYTNASQDGALKENDLPPAALDICEWKGCLWWFNCRPQERVAIALVDADRTDDGLTYTNHAADITNTSPTLTNLASTTDIHVGMAISTTANQPDNIAPYFNVSAQDELYVISKTATTVTMSKNAASSGVGVTVYFYDKVKVDMDGDSLFYAAGASGSPSGRETFTVTANDERATARSLAAKINARFDSGLVVASVFGEDAFSIRPGQMLLEEAGVNNVASEANLKIASTAPTAFELSNGNLPAWSNPFFNTLYEEPNTLRWSKPDEPEHVPGTNFARIGRIDRDGMRVVPLEQSLLIFKADGIWRLTGTPPNGWRIDEVALDVRLLSTGAVCVLGNRCYAWTDRGIVVVDEGGYQLLSEPLIGMRHETGELRSIALSFTVGNTVKGCFAVAWPTRGLVCFALPSGASNEYSQRWWVYCPDTDAWTRFDLVTRCAAFSPSVNAMFLEPGQDDFFELRRERTSLGENDTYDDTHAVTLSTTGSTTVTMTTGNADRWVPTAGDILSAGGAKRVLSAVLDAGTWTITLDSAASGSSVTAYEAIGCSLTWAPVVADSLHRTFVFREAVAHLREVSNGLIDVDLEAYIGGRTDWQATLQETEINFTEPNQDEGERLKKLRCWPKRAIAMCSELTPRFRITDPGVTWVLAGMTLLIEPMGEAVTR